MKEIKTLRKVNIMVLGIDIGATKTVCAVLREGRLRKSERIRTKSEPEEFFDDLCGLIENFTGDDMSSIGAIGIGAPGPIRIEEGIFGCLPNLGLWDGFEMRKALESRYSVPVKIQNDANAACLGEAIFGGGRGFRSVFYITISTGIGGGFAIDGNIVNGGHDLTGELWTLPVENFGEEDILINTASGPGIVRNVRRMLRESDRSTPLEEDFDTEDVFKCADRGDPLCVSAVRKAIDDMSTVVISVLLIVDPDVVLIGGGMACSESLMIDPMRAKIAENGFLQRNKHAEIRRAELWDEAVLYGALSLFGKPALEYR